MWASMCLLILAILCCCWVRPSDAFVGDLMRRLTGYNCVRIEDGKVPPYYTCLGCVIEEAIGCVDDMRQNMSGNVGTGCDMGVISESYNGNCCPKFGINPLTNRLDLLYVGSAYPDTLRCINSVGCASSVIYSQLLAECTAVCPKDVDQTGKPACMANFNAAPRKYSNYIVISAGMSAVAAVFMLFI
jgi:hypothetical protein